MTYKSKKKRKKIVFKSREQLRQTDDWERTTRVIKGNGQENAWCITGHRKDDRGGLDSGMRK